MSLTPPASPPSSPRPQFPQISRQNSAVRQRPPPKHPDDIIPTSASQTTPLWSVFSLNPASSFALTAPRGEPTRPWPTLFPLYPHLGIPLLIVTLIVSLPILSFTWPIVLALYPLYYLLTYVWRANHYGHTLHPVPWNEAWKVLPPANAKNAPGLPPSLYGVWQMSGNPLPDALMTFAGGVPSVVELGEDDVGIHEGPKRKRARRMQRRYTLKVYEQNTWTWHGDIFGTALYHEVKRNRLRYEGRFSEDLKYAQIYPIVTIPFVDQDVVVPPYLACFTLREVGEGHWIRESWFFCIRMLDYHFVRVVDEKGRRDEERWDMCSRSRVPGRTMLVAKSVPSTESVGKSRAKGRTTDGGRK
ncbi:uncharacterized protein EV422DRAFT_538820 [Fimicolochytrium jonesii]|uniref:uncharacterized protein n=1 Tax=Fimicolochytrium jonesii TaxID=1396493 RepID=UPI0022FEECCD|nr:uncharacterized protein EV422DRAFT_538820 [Fimicolochytrium jonesii]KAI8818127.1 hypothetical protein EV422DRAFT_538820 [Fimicolochytrium jonesii]